MSRMKDMIIDILETGLRQVSHETGYDERFLWDRYWEMIDDGEDWQEALRFVSAVSYERDW